MQVSLKVRIASAIIGLGVLSSLTMGIISWQVAQSRLIDAAQNHLAFVANSTSVSLKLLALRTVSVISNLAENPLIASAVSDLAEALDPKDEDYSALMKAFTSPASVQERLANDGSATRTMYGNRHVKLHKEILKILKEGDGYSDVLLIDPQGRIVYTATKSIDFGRNVSDPELNSTGLNKLFQRLKASDGKEAIPQPFGDYPADPQPSAFIGATLTRRANVAMGSAQQASQVGYVILRIAPAAFAAALSQREGMGESGQILAIGEQDHLLRNNPPLLNKKVAGTSISSLGINPADLGQKKFLEYSGWDKTDKIAALANESVLGIPLILIAEQNRSEALSSVSFLIKTLGTVGATIIVLTIFAGLFFARSIATPISLMTQSMLRLASGDQSVAIRYTDRKDEIGQMANAVQAFKDAAIEKTRLETTAAAARITEEQERLQREQEAEASVKAQEFVVNALGKALSRLSDGDLSFEMRETFRSEYEKIRHDFNTAVGKLRETVTLIEASTKAIHSGTEEIAGAAQDLTRRTEQQAASLEETSASLNEISSMGKNIAKGAGDAREVVAAAKADADQSGEIVSKAIGAMGQIENSSKQINQTISVIDEIAFQTNLLALNAGVEAARAGDAGRGFAVVAMEVRVLAQRSAEAAKEIKALVANSARNVGDGVYLVGEAGAALRRIAGQVTELNDIISHIAHGAQDQANHLQEVNSAVNQIDQMTQQNGAMVEETTAAAGSLNQETNHLSELISRFQLERSNHARLQAAA